MSIVRPGAQHSAVATCPRIGSCACSARRQMRARTQRNEARRELGASCFACRLSASGSRRPNAATAAAQQDGRMDWQPRPHGTRYFQRAVAFEHSRNIHFMREKTTTGPPSRVAWAVGRGEPGVETGLMPIWRGPELPPLEKTHEFFYM